MKKITILTLIFLTTTLLSACGQDDTHKIGASPTPHADILRHVQPQLAELGFDFEIIEFTDYVLPNVALDNQELIGNFFQHEPYLNTQISEHGYDFINVGGVHIEPIGLYSRVHESQAALPDDLHLIISNSPSDRPRLLGLLHDAGIIEILDGVSSDDIINATTNNLTNLFKAPGDITFTEVDPTQLYSNYFNQSGDAVLINGNYALDHGLNPLEDALFIEGSESDYVNILVTNTGDETHPFIRTLIEVLQSTEVQQWIEDTYDGAVVPAG